MIVYVNKDLIFNALPRTNGGLIAAALLRQFPKSGVIDSVPEGFEGTIVSTIKNPFHLVLEWFQVNPNWNDFTKFIQEYNHSHFVREGTLFWHLINEDDTLLRDEKGITALNELLGEELDVVIPPTEDYRESYSPEAVAAVEMRFAGDLEKFDYTF